MKFFRKAIVCLVAAVLVFGCMTACNKKKKEETNTEDDTQKVYDGGKHDIIVGETNDDLLHGGETDYKIVLPKEANEYETNTAGEISYFFKQATAVDLPVVTDEGLTHTAENKYISVGNTSLKTAANVTTDYGVLGESGYVIKTVGKSVFLASASRVGFGTLYAGYEFLHHTVGYEAYGPDTIYTEKNVRNLKLPAFDITDVPDFEWRMASYGQLDGKQTEANRMRMNLRTNGSVMTRVDGNTTHSVEKLLPKENYTDPQYADWFGDDGFQMCYTAHGNREKYEALVNETVEQSKKWIDADPDSEYYMLGMADKQTWCTCTACSAEREKYGTDAAVYIKWANDVAEKLEKWLGDERDGRKITIGIFAYNKVTDAPARLGADGKYAPIDDSVVLRDNISVLYAPIQADFTKSMYEDKKGFASNMDAWRSLTKKLSIWYYQAYFNEYFVPYDNFGAMRDNYVFAKEHGAYWMFDQGQHGNVESSGFNRLKLYLNSKLQWNVNQDVNELTRNFFTHTYGPAAENMMRLYEALRVQFHKLEADEKVTGYIYQQVATQELWSKGTLDGFMKYIEKAYADIAPLETSDRAQYTAYYDKICLESLSYRYLLIQLYAGRYSDAELYESKQSFRADVSRLGVNHFQESVDVAELWSAWGI